jgi:hypothetical protein
VGQHLEVAFANYRFWESFGLAAAFLMMRFTTTEIFLYILLTSLFLGMLGYGAIEMWEYLNVSTLLLVSKSVLSPKYRDRFFFYPIPI